MNEINWSQFMLKNPNPQDAFETICRNLFLREYKVSSHGFSSNYNQAGLETEPVLFENKYYGFQCKFSISGNSDSLYAQVLESLTKAVMAYPNLNTVIVYTNLNIKPNISSLDLLKKRKSVRVKIHELAQKNNLEIVWFLKPNFEKALNDIENYDLYRSFFSPQDTQGLLRNALTHDERTFLTSNQFIDLSLNGKKFSEIREAILLQNISIITGAAGTGKSEILKKLYLQCEQNYLLNVNRAPSDNAVAIPIFIRMRECINGDLEGLLRNRLKDFDISIVNNQNNYVYFFDGIDEISALDFGNVITCIVRLKDKESTKGLVISSRINTANLTTVLRDCKPITYKIDSLKSSDVIDYFNRLNNQEKDEKLQDIRENNSSFFEDITDIFSTVLLSKNIFQINKTTTKVDLIELNTENLVESNRKYPLINLPEPKMVAVKKILGQVSETMQRTGNISISRFDLQNIINKLFPNCSYAQIDEIIEFISEMFFDSSAEELQQKRYSYRHKRYFEFFLYNAIRNVFYDNPAILRELRLLSNKDFIINIFLAQEMKNNELSSNIQKMLVLRFFETYLGDNYFYDAKISWQTSKAPLVGDAASYLQSEALREYLCTKNIDDLRDFLKTDPLSIKGFLTSANYYSFVKQYHKKNILDIRELLNEVYDIPDDWLKKAKEKDQCSFLYCKCVIDQESITSAYDAICTIPDVVMTDLDYYPYTQNSSNLVVDFFELALDSFDEWLLSTINDISINHLEVLSYTLLRTQNLRYIIKDDRMSPIAEAISNRINSYITEPYGIHTIVLYNVLTDDGIVQKTAIEERAKDVNIYHYETWRRNIELNSYIGVVLGAEFSPYHYDYRLGIALRKIVNDCCVVSKKDMLSKILQEVNKYNLVCKNWFSYYNAIFIGETIANMDINHVDVKGFIAELSKYDSVVSIFQILYVLMKQNAELFKIIANPSLIVSAYTKASQNLSYYDYNSDLAFKYATMIAHFDIVKADALFDCAINNSLFRPFFRKENMLDYHLSSCLLTVYDNHWLSNKEIELYIKRVDRILKIAKDTLDSGAYGGYLKYLVEHCCPNLSNIIKDIDMEAINPRMDMEYESYGSKIAMENVTFENLSDYYACKVDGINYMSVPVWKKLIGFELEKDSSLDILYKTIEKNYFPGYGTIKMSNCFHVIIATLISDVKTKPKAMEFIMTHSGRMGLVYLINAFALIGDDCSGRQYLEALIKLCEAMVYPSAEYIEAEEFNDARTDKIIEKICNSKSNDWEEDAERCIMYYMPDSKLSIRWDQFEEQVPFNEEWAINYPNKNAFSIQYYFYYQDELIKEFDMVWVDGYRALIPMPDIRNKHITRESYSLACIVNHSVEILNQYILGSGLIVD